MANTVAFPKIIALGGVGIGSIFDEEVEITEKLDGSQFGFGIIDGQLVCRSKGKEQDIDNTDKMFIEGVEYVKSVQQRLKEGYFYYGEYLQKPRHSTLAYNNIPQNHIALFGIMDSTGDEHVMRSYTSVSHEAEYLGVDIVPLIFQGKAKPEDIKPMLERESYLGGQKIEGVVVKNYKPWLFMNQILYPVMAGKFVSEAFKEVHRSDWSKLNTGKGQMEGLKDKYRSEARWHKAVMRLKEEGRYTQSLKDIGELVKEVQKDLGIEEKENIKRDLWKLFGADIVRYATTGLPNWYKEQLLLGESEDGQLQENGDVSSDSGISET